MRVEGGLQRACGGRAGRMTGEKGEGEGALGSVVAIRTPMPAGGQGARERVLTGMAKPEARGEATPLPVNSLIFKGFRMRSSVEQCA